MSLISEPVWVQCFVYISSTNGRIKRFKPIRLRAAFKQSVRNVRGMHKGRVLGARFVALLACCGGNYIDFAPRRRVRVARVSGREKPHGHLSLCSVCEAFS